MAWKYRRIVQVVKKPTRCATPWVPARLFWNRAIQDKIMRDFSVPAVMIQPPGVRGHCEALDSYVPLKFQLHTEDSGWNADGYSNARMDELVDAIATETDFAKRDAMIAEAWQISVDDVVYLPLHHQVIAWAMNDKVSIPIAGGDFVRFHNATFK
jgi:hypothetical protein